MLDVGLGAAEKASDVLVARTPRWIAAAVLASSMVSLAMGTAFLAAWVAFFLPVALALSAATVAALAALAPPALALGWVLACTGPACEQLWRPLLVREGGREGKRKKHLFFIGDDGKGMDAAACCLYVVCVLLIG